MSTQAVAFVSSANFSSLDIVADTASSSDSQAAFAIRRTSDNNREPSPRSTILSTWSMVTWVRASAHMPPAASLMSFFVSIGFSVLQECELVEDHLLDFLNRSAWLLPMACSFHC